MAAATAGLLAAPSSSPGLAAWLGESRLRAIVDRLPLVETADIDRASAWFARHGGPAVLIGRTLPVVCSLISLPAGLNRMPLPRFVAYTVLDSAASNVLLIGLGARRTVGGDPAMGLGPGMAGARGARRAGRVVRLAAPAHA